MTLAHSQGTTPASWSTQGLSTTTTRILVVEDEHDIAGLIKHTLERERRRASTIVSSGDAALKAVAEQQPHLVILDLNLPVLSGIRGVPDPAVAPDDRAACRSSC